MKRSALILLFCLACRTMYLPEAFSLTVAPKRHTYRVIGSFAHDPDAFTQGLTIGGGVLYEGTGLRQRSSLRRVDLCTGRVMMRIDLPPHLFGEGITVMADRVYQLTWQSHTGFVYSARDFQKLGTFSYPMEGWGLTHDGRHLIMSDGTEALYFLNPEDLTITHRIHVTDPQGPVRLLNELEYINGRVFANVWQKDHIAVIDPATGGVTAWIDLSGLYLRQTGERQPEVLNGIAYDPENAKLYVTGKLWKRVFQIEIVPEIPSASPEPNPQ